MLGAIKQAKQLASKPTSPRRQLPASWHPLGFFSTGSSLLELEEVQKVLSDVKADDVRVINVGDQCDWTDHIVIATGRSSWHVKNIAQALIYKVKQKQKGADRMFLPSVEGQGGGKWVVIDSGTVIVHALDEKARAYYDLESHWTKERTPKGSVQFVRLLSMMMMIVRRTLNEVVNPQGLTILLFPTGGFG